MRRPVVVIAAAAAVIVAVVIGLSQAGTGEDSPRVPGPTAEQARRALQGAPPALAALHRQGNELLGGGTAAIRERLRELRGYPVVINKWASWCGPCRYEFPFFQRAAVRHGKVIAFLGLNAGDNHGDAQRFLDRYPLPFPSYEDPNERVARDLGVPANYPITAFYDARGREVFVHQGGYPTQARLDADIERYALR